MDALLEEYNHKPDQGSQLRTETMRSLSLFNNLSVIKNLLAMKGVFVLRTVCASMVSAKGVMFRHSNIVLDESQCTSYSAMLHFYILFDL